MFRLIDAVDPDGMGSNRHFSPCVWRDRKNAGFLDLSRYWHDGWKNRNEMTTSYLHFFGGLTGREARPAGPPEGVGPCGCLATHGFRSVA